jgi:hypothetical protein
MSKELELKKLYTELGHLVMDDKNFKKGIFQWIGRQAEIRKRIAELESNKAS